DVEVVRDRVVRGAQGFKGQAEVSAVGLALEPGDDTEGELRDRTFLSGRRLEDMQHAHAVVVRDEGQPLSVPRQVEILNAPGEIAREISELLRREVEVPEPVKLRIAVRRDVQPLPVP